MKEIQLTKGYVTIVDDDIYDWVNGMRWHALTTPSGKVYASGAAKHLGNGKEVSLHRVVLATHTYKTMDVDHINGDTLDNRKCNLRLATRSQNLSNQKKKDGTKFQYKGVVYRKDRDRYMAHLTKDGKRYTSKKFKTIEEAALAYNTLAIKHQGEFAYINKIEPTPSPL